MNINTNIKLVVISYKNHRIFVLLPFVISCTIFYLTIESNELIFMLIFILTIFLYLSYITVLYRYFVIDVENRTITYRDFFKLNKRIHIDSNVNFAREKNGKKEHIILKVRSTRLFKIAKFDLKFGLEQLSESDFLEFLRINFKTHEI